MNKISNCQNLGYNKPDLFLVSEEFPPFTPGGIATYHKTLSQKLNMSGEMGDITVLCKAIDGITPGEYDEDGVKVIRIEPYFKKMKLLAETIGYKLKVAKTLIEERKKKNIDIIESPEWNQELFFYYIYNYITFNFFENKKITLRLHTPLFVTKELNNLKNTFSNRVNIIMEKFLIDNVESVTACSKSLVNEMGKYHTLRDDISIIHNPGNNTLFDKDKDFEDEFNLREDGKINILFAGSLEYRKGIDTFCKAMKKILDSNPNIKIVLSGKYGGSDNANSKLSKDEILSFFSKSDIDRIVFLGLVKYEKMPNVYKHVDICIFPSKYDNYPGVVIESLLMGKAVIGSKNTGISEAVKKGIIYIDPFDVNQLIYETEKLITSENARNELGDIGHSEVQGLNKQILEKFILHYKDLKKNSVLADERKLVSNQTYIVNG